MLLKRVSVKSFKILLAVLVLSIVPLQSSSYASEIKEVVSRPYVLNNIEKDPITNEIAYDFRYGGEFYIDKNGRYTKDDFIRYYMQCESGKSEPEFHIERITASVLRSGEVQIVSTENIKKLFRGMIFQGHSPVTSEQHFDNSKAFNLTYEAKGIPPRGQKLFFDDFKDGKLVDSWKLQLFMNLTGTGKRYAYNIRQHEIPPYSKSFPGINLLDYCGLSDKKGDLIDLPLENVEVSYDDFTIREIFNKYDEFQQLAKVKYNAVFKDNYRNNTSFILYCARDPEGGYFRAYAQNTHRFNTVRVSIDGGPEFKFDRKYEGVSTKVTNEFQEQFFRALWRGQKAVIIENDKTNYFINLESLRANARPIGQRCRP